MTNLNGTWSLIEIDDNFIDVLTKIGVSFLNRQTMATIKPDLVIALDPTGNCVMQWKTSIKNTEEIFQLDTLFKSTRSDGKVIDANIILEDNKKLIKTWIGAGDKGENAVDNYEVVDGKLVLTTTVGTLKATNIYSRLR